MPPALTPDTSRQSRDSTSPPVIAADDQRSLLDLVRVTLAVATRTADVSALEQAPGLECGADEFGGAFVTLTHDGVLRGCMGRLARTRDLRAAIAASALDAALEDPRFLPLTAAELPTIDIAISVLGRPRSIDGPDAFEPGIDGVIIERDGRRGLLLPEVATEFSWGAVEMFGAVCRKAGLPGDAWRDPRARLQAFRTYRFGGPATTRR
jgi:AmmeMemoRadiSam system protein A